MEPLPSLGFDRDRAAELLGEAEDLAEAEPGALAKALGGEERLEHALHRLARHARAGVGDPERDMLAPQPVGLALEHVVGAR